MYQANVVNAMPNNGSFERYRAEMARESRRGSELQRGESHNFSQEAYRLCDVGAMAEMVNIDKTQMARDKDRRKKVGAPVVLVGTVRYPILRL